MQAPVRIVFYLRVREAWIDLKNKNDAKNEREPRINGMIVYIYIYYSILQLYSWFLWFSCSTMGQWGFLFFEDEDEMLQKDLGGDVVVQWQRNQNLYRVLPLVMGT